MSELRSGERAASPSSERLESRKRSRRGEVFGLVCFRFGLAPAQLASLSDAALVKCFAATTGRSADLSILRQAAAEYATAHAGDAPVQLALRSTDPAAPAPRTPEPRSGGPAAMLRLNTVTRLELIAEALRDRGTFIPVWPASVGPNREQI